jgi:hypothetical protein
MTANPETGSVAALVETGGDLDVAAAQVAFHLAIGAEHVAIVCSSPHQREQLGRFYADDPRVAVAATSALAREVVAGAGWVIETRAGEFWWPRAGSLTELLDALPRRYGTINGLVRRLVLGADVPGDAIGRAVAREARSRGRAGMDVRPLHRADVAHWLRNPNGSVRPGDPLRGWYPLEVLTLPASDVPAPTAAELEAELSEGSLVPDTRLSDLMATLRDDACTGAPFRLPRPGEVLELPPPSLVDEAQYAVDAAAVGEGAPEAVREHLTSIEERVARLESGLWRRIPGWIVRHTTGRR